MASHYPSTRRRRNGRLQACEPCRIAKHRCDHVTPVCNRCRGKPASCVYHPAPMTKIRDSSVTSRGKLPKLLPDVRSPTVERLQRVSPQSTASYTSSYRSPRTLFRRTCPTTSFGAVFHENQAQIGADLLNIDDGIETQPQVFDNPARMKLALQTLRDFPTFQTCERLLVAFSSLHDVWLSPKMITHCLKSVWTTFGNALKGSRPDHALSSIASLLFQNGDNPPVPDNDQPWINWFAGSSLRWEMIGVLFTFFGMTMQVLQDWDPLFTLPEQHGRTRKLASLRMKECADACLDLRNTHHPINIVVVMLWKNSGKLLTQIAGDECDEVTMAEGAMSAAFIEAGLHRLPVDKEIDPVSQFKKWLSASGYYLDKSAALLHSRPPAFTRFYSTRQVPLDLTEDELFGTPEDLVSAVSRLNKDGWNTYGRVSTICWVRALVKISPIREEILEIAFGMNMQVPAGRIEFSPDVSSQLLENLSQIISSYPPWLQYQNVGKWAQSTSSTEKDNVYIVTRIHAEILQTKFLLERLKNSVSAKRPSQALFDVAQELMAVTLAMWIDRDRLYKYQHTFHWMAVDYGIPAAGILCIELLYSVRHPHATDNINMSKSDTIQMLIHYLAFLDWVRVSDGNYELCRRLRKLIRNILDHVLEADTTYSEKNGTTTIDYESIHTDHLDPNWHELGETDWLNMLNNMDWTQGFEREAFQ